MVVNFRQKSTSRPLCQGRRRVREVGFLGMATILRTADSAWTIYKTQWQTRTSRLVRYVSKFSYVARVFQFYWLTCEIRRFRFVGGNTISSKCHWFVVVHKRGYTVISVNRPLYDSFDAYDRWSQYFDLDSSTSIVYLGVVMFLKKKTQCKIPF